MIILLIVLMVVLLIFSTPLFVEFSYAESFKIIVKYGFFKCYENKNSEKKNGGKVSEKNTDFQLKNISNILEKSKKTLILLGKHIRFKEIFIDYRFGFSDAAVTGMYSGGAYAVIYAFIGYIDSKYPIKNKKVVITPDFDNECQDFKFSFKIKMSLIRFVTLGTKAISIWIK